MILSWITADRILFHGFHPTTNMIVLSGVAILSLLAGWRLFGDASNYHKLRSLVFIALISLTFFKLTSELDELYLRNTLTTGNPLTYQFLDSETYVAYVEEKQKYYTDFHLNSNQSWMQLYQYLPPYDKLDRGGFIKSLEEPYVTNNHPALAIERSWAYKDYYGLFSMLLIAACLSAGFYTTKRFAMRNLALKS